MKLILSRRYKILDFRFWLSQEVEGSITIYLEYFVTSIDHTDGLNNNRINALKSDFLLTFYKIIIRL